jgi:lysine 2,3-aminomutase
MKHLQGWLSGITMPKYAANIEGGGGKVLLMPSGHDTLNLEASIDEKISESFALVSTWDGKKIYRYESLGRATQDEFEDAMEIMNRFIGRKGVFFPKVIIVDEKGKHIETTFRSKLPIVEQLKKSQLLDYTLNGKNAPLTNPQDILEELDAFYLQQKR